jgi:surface antigen
MQARRVEDFGVMQSIDHRAGGAVCAAGIAHGAASTWLRTALALCLAGACSLAAAVGWIQILKNTAAESFEEDDIRMFLDAANKALNNDGPREPVDWANPETGAGGSFLVVGQSAGTDGAPCKRVRFTTYARKYPKATTTWTACKAADGRWRLTTAG